LIARAPGKVVVSGAYAVLEGAPAIVTAVDRYVTADTSRPPHFTTPEVRAALGERTAPWFDATPLRDGDEKLGLGSSAAILVASLGAVLAEETAFDGDADLRKAVLDRAIVAHRVAQGGGSGVDVATSTLGGTIAARRDGDLLRTHAVVLPRELHLALLAAGVPASTSALVAKVNAAKSASRADYDAVMERLFRAADEAERGFETGSAELIVAALALQLVGLTDLGRLAGASIVTPEVARLSAHAGREGAVVLPAGAGGGDIAIYAGIAPPSAELRRAFDAERHRTLDVRFGVRGLHQIPRENAVG